MGYIVATDGACKGNPGPGTWAFVVFNQRTTKMLGHKKGHDSHTTNNRMELTAIIMALTWAKKHCNKIHIKTDSDHCKKGIEEWMPMWKVRQWRTAKGQPVMNKDLWEQIDSFPRSLYTLEKVKGHSGDKFNEAADMYCNEEYVNVFI